MADSFMLKVNRAVAHLDQLSRQVETWLTERHYTCWLERDAEDHSHSILKVEAEPVPADPFSLLIGDVVQNLRNGLDHLAFQLATTFSKQLPGKLARQSQFLIIGDANRDGQLGCGAAEFERQRKMRIGGMDPEAQAVVENFQPYKLERNFDIHPLWQLAELSNSDKHRILHVGRICSGGVKLIVDKLPMVNGRPVSPFTVGEVRVFSAGILEGETGIARLPFPLTDSERHFDTPFEPAFDIVFADGLVARQTVTVVLMRIYEYIVREVVPALQPFLRDAGSET